MGVPGGGLRTGEGLWDSRGERAAGVSWAQRVEGYAPGGPAGPGSGNVTQGAGDSGGAWA